MGPKTARQSLVARAEGLVRGMLLRRSTRCVSVGGGVVAGGAASAVPMALPTAPSMVAPVYTLAGSSSATPRFDPKFPAGVPLL